MDPVRTLEEANLATVAHGGLFQNVGPVGLEICYQSWHVVGIDGYVLDAVLLLVLLAIDELVDVQGEAGANGLRLDLHGLADNLGP